MDYKDILVEKEAGIAIVTLNRPQVLNALSLEMRISLATIFQDFRTDDSVRVIVLTGAGRAFCAGADIKDMAEIKPPVEAKNYVRNVVHPAMLAITSLEKPIIAMVNGPATGAGCCIALLCDLIIAGESARFGFTFVRVGLPLDWGSSYFLPRLVGSAKAKELIFTGKIIDAREADKINLINMVVPNEELKMTTMNLAHQLAKGASGAIGAAKTAINRGLDVDFKTAMEYEANMAALFLQSADHEEGVKAFLEKRNANFQGK